MFVVSPYLQLQKKRGNHRILLNYFTNKLAHLNEEQYRMLRYLRTPREKDQVLNFYTRANFEKALNDRLVFTYETLWKQHRYFRTEIETISSCNWKCVCCPQHSIPRERKVMSMDLFDTVLDRCVEYGKFQKISLHHMSEPSIDPYLLQRMEAIKRRGLILEFFTNGANLSEEAIQTMKELGNVNKLVFNFPSADSSEFEQLTGTQTYENSRRSIELACAYNLPVYVTVLSKPDHTNLDQVKALFPKARCNATMIQDRAGNLKEEKYRDNIHVSSPRMSGCFYFLHILYVNVNGELIPCVNDTFAQKYIHGNVNEQSIEKIIESEEAQTLRKTIFGAIAAPDDFMCRSCVFMRKNELDLLMLWEEESK